ncbi:MAG: carboxypeptidase-like regulatory domain-containing protein [Emticicia sp.]|uniref:carboxypeptidase-like regulatory domain-containing protein n=1 Tax=Emticicia sp. TaxID=1930953 RepID=UPI003BA77E17
MYKLSVKKCLLGICCFLITQLSFAQTKVSGTITDATTKEPLIGVSVQVKGKVVGTITNSKGEFSFNVSTPPPFTLLISSVGYESQEINVSGNNASINIALKEQAVLGQEVVVSASRVEESVLKSPVAVEKMDIRTIRETASPSFYDALSNMKGIDMTTQGLLFKSINMRGFGATGNPRTVQMIDGMDNQAPGLNFPVDNIVGMPELDVENVEVLPGAASALYGPNAINGLVLMNSKSPFLYQGLSATLKTGVMSASNRATATTPFGDFSMRYAKASKNNKFAFKVNLAYITAKDWEATDYTNLNLGGVQNGTRGAGVDTDYDGMNIYGDEVQANMGTVLNGLLGASSPLTAAQKAGIQAVSSAGLIPTSANISRTGFLEKDMVDYNTKSFKTNLAAHYRINDKVELVGQVNYGYGTTVYTGTGRYSLRNFNLTQAKVELRGDNFTLRAYTTQERSGQSYTAGLAAVAMLNSVKPHATWFAEYVGAFAAARGAGQAEDAAHLTARAAADKGLPAAGTAEYKALLDKYRDAAIVDGGGAFLDKTNLYHAEGVYNFKNQVKFIDLLAGANVRQYSLRSDGTLFADKKEGRSGTIPINEYGAFVQAAKSLFKDHLKLSASIRYDKSQNFKGFYTPRLSAVATFGQQNFRASYQTGYRIPTTQNQYIDLRTPSGTLIGGQPEFDTRYNLANGVDLATLTAFSVAAPTEAKNIAEGKISENKYLTADVLAKAQAYATAAVNAQLANIQALVTAGVQTQVTALVTPQINAAVAAGQIPANQAAAAIAAEVARQMASPTVQATIQTNVQATVRSQIAAVTSQVAPAFGLAALPKYKVAALQPEKIESYEIGYKGLIAKKLFIDSYFYTSKYTNFIGGTAILVPKAAAALGLPIESGLGSGSTREAYSRVANSKEIIRVNGFAVSANYTITKGYNVGFNFAQNNLKDFTSSPEQLYAGYNTPKNRYNLSFGKRMNSGDKFGFNINFRHQDSFVWQASFNQPTTTGTTSFTNTTVPKITNLDAQISYKLSSMKSIIKLGGTNIGGKPYIQAFGSAAVGSMYYVAITFDELLNK